MKNLEMSNEWNVGDKFTTPETGQIIFTVSKVANFDVEAIDGRSMAGYTVFSKSYITKVWEVKKSQVEIEIDKFDTLPKIVEQLEKCNYETEAGFLNNNIAFLSLKRLASLTP